jgi:hypothetical protein
MSRAAYLRIFVPERRVDPVLEHVGAVAPGRRVLTRGEYGMLHESSRDDAFVREVEGTRYVCPRYPRLRMLEGLIAFRNAYQGPTASMLVPQSTADRALRELDRMHDRRPGARSHILTSPFYVPLRWFAAFEPSERELVEEEGRLTIRYRAPVSAAVSRLRHAVDVLDSAGFDSTIVDQVVGVLEWMEDFPPDALVELDYGSVASLFSRGDLVLDETAAEVAASLEALEDGDMEEAGERYAAAASRWAHAQSLSFAN